jgi:hypothetical protein
MERQRNPKKNHRASIFVVETRNKGEVGEEERSSSLFVVFLLFFCVPLHVALNLGEMKWQHLKSSAVLQWIDEQEIVPSLQAPEGEEFDCAGCNTDLGGLNYIEVKFFKSMFLMG